MLIDAIVSLGGLIIPPAFDFIKKKFLKRGEDTPEATMSALATTKPEVLGQYVEALSNYTKSQVLFFNRDVIGTLPVWVSALRAVIRPTTVIFGLLHLTLHGLFGDAFVLEPGTRYFYEAVIGSWFGTRMTKG